MMRFLLVMTLALATTVFPGCTPDPAGQVWSPVTDVDDPGGPGTGFTLRLPGDDPSAIVERVDPDEFLIVGVHYDACHWSDPRLVGAGRDRIEVQLVELPRYCVQPIPRLAWFALAWSELPRAVTLVDPAGEQTMLRDRRRV